MSRNFTHYQRYLFQVPTVKSKRNCTRSTRNVCLAHLDALSTLAKCTTALAKRNYAPTTTRALLARLPTPSLCLLREKKTTQRTIHRPICRGTSLQANSTKLNFNYRSSCLPTGFRRPHIGFSPSLPHPPDNVLQTTNTVAAKHRTHATNHKIKRELSRFWAPASVRATP